MHLVADLAEHLLDDLNDAQREAIGVSAGPLVILAGGGTGKTRVISWRAAHAIESGVVPAGKVRSPRSPTRRPTRWSSEWRASATAASWPAPSTRTRSGSSDTFGRAITTAKGRRIAPDQWEQDPQTTDRAPIPADLFARIYAGYERAKQHLGKLDFEDMLALTVVLLESDEGAARVVQAQKTWISVDEYQDTNPLQERLLELFWANRPTSRSSAIPTRRSTPSPAPRQRRALSRSRRQDWPPPSGPARRRHPLAVR